MPLVGLNINGRRYEVVCRDGEEDQVRELAVELDRKARTMVQETGASSEGLVLVLAALVLADELRETRKTMFETQNELCSAQAGVQNLLTQSAGERALAERLDVENKELQAQLQEARAAVGDVHRTLRLRRENETQLRDQEEKMVETLEVLAERVERVAQRLCSA